MYRVETFAPNLKANETGYEDFRLRLPRRSRIVNVVSTAWKHNVVSNAGQPMIVAEVDYQEDKLVQGKWKPLFYPQEYRWFSVHATADHITPQETYVGSFFNVDGVLYHIYEH